eukprot:2462206-Prymnesium_polylepis.2
MGGTPVGHDPSLEAQSVLQVLLEGCWVLTRPLSVDEVVAAHDGSNVCFDRTLERRIVTARRTHTDSTASASRNGTRNDTAIAATLASPSHFVAGALVDNGIVGGAVDLLVVVDPMLAVRHDPHRLNALVQWWNDGRTSVDASKASGERAGPPRYGSSPEAYSKLRPFLGNRATHMPGPSSTFAPLPASRSKLVSKRVRGGSFGLDGVCAASEHACKL